MSAEQTPTALEYRDNSESTEWKLITFAPSPTQVMEARRANADLGWQRYRLEKAEDLQTFSERLERIVSEISLGMNCEVRIGISPEGRRFVQIQCWRMDVITKEMGWGYGGKGYPSEHASDSEIIQMIFGLYKGYWEHEARETFEWRGRRPFGPHISTEALWEVARRVDVRSQRHVDDQPEARA